MSGKEIQASLEALSEAIVLASQTDPQALANVHGQLESIRDLIEGEGAERLKKAVSLAADILQDYIFDDVDDKDVAFEIVVGTISALQEIFCDNRPIDKVEFPVGLGLDDVIIPDEPEVKPKKTKARKRKSKKALTNDGDKPVKTGVKEPVALSADPGLLGDFVLEAIEHLDASDVNLLTLETDPLEHEALNAVFRAFHTIKGIAGFLVLDEIGHLAHEAETLLDKCRNNELDLVGGVIDVTFDSVDMLKRMTESVRTCVESGDLLHPQEGMDELIDRIQVAIVGEEIEEFDLDPPPRKVGEILIDQGTVTREDVDEALIRQQETDLPKPKIGEILVNEKKASAKDVARALRVQGKVQGMHVRESIKVDAERLDRLIETIGELVIAESMVRQAEGIQKLNDTHLVQQLGQLDKITRELQEMGMGLRMVQVKGVFQKMARLVRDLSKKSGKPIDFKLTGEDTELDKNVVDQIGDPLIHLVRNAVDHGIEASTKDRLEAGKPEKGRIELRAFHKGGNIYIEIEDDGAGIDKAAVLAKAVEQGLIRKGEHLSEREIFNLILRPGFTTAKVVTDVSGRGVGMDVVKKNIDALRGQINIKSEPGKGSTFTIRLPLTLAIIDGMVVRVREDRYIIPTLSVIRSLRPKGDEAQTMLKQGEMLNLREGLVPLIRLDNLFDLTGEDEEKLDLLKTLVVIVESDGKRAGFVVDELIGQQQTVIKSLGEEMMAIDGLSGGAIMPDGRVGLILDVGGLVKQANIIEEQSYEKMSDAR